MPVPESVQRTLDDMGQEFRRGGYVPYHENHEFILSAARDDPNSVLTVAHQLCVAFNSGRINAGDYNGLFGLLAELARISQDLREKIQSGINGPALEYHAAVPNTERLINALSLEFPAHYFEICRNIVAGTNGCLFVVGAGFSYSAQAPLLNPNPRKEGVGLAS